MSDRPVWLLDVDGVINASRPGWGEAPMSRNVVAESGKYGGLHEYRIRWAPGLISRIRQLIRAEAVEVRWCSTWCGNAEGLERAMGLPHLESAFVVPPGEFVGELKANAARNVLWSGRRLVWTDDMETPTQGPLYDELTADGRALLIRPHGGRGLRPEDVDTIDEFCSASMIR